MRTLPLQCCVVGAALSIFGCSADAGPGYVGNSGTGNSTGGISTATGGTSSGGSVSGGSPSTGGSFSATGGTTEAGSGGAKGGGGGRTSGGTNAGGRGSTTGGRGNSSGGTSGGGRSSVTGGANVGGAAAGSSSTAGAPSFGTKFVGNITTGNGIDSGGKVFAKYWDQITPENAGKWGSVQSSASAAFNWGTLDSIYEYTQKNNIIFKQHVFIWGSQQPSGSISEANVKNWMSSFCKRYPNTKLIDVVNEPPPHTTPSYANSIGGGTNGTWQWIINAFKWAREACPNAILILNDYNNIEWTNDASHFVSIVKAIKAGGAPIDAVGAQAHDLDHASVSTSTAQGLLTKLNADTGLPVYITELDISTSDDNAQLTAYKTWMTTFLDADYIKGITIWGWIYGSTWSQAPDSGLVRNGTPRPAMTWLMQQLGRPSP